MLASDDLGLVRPEDEEGARRLGVRAVILEPNTVEELGQVLDRLFRERTSEPAAS